MSKTLVTGGCGFIGSELVKRLVSDGEDVRVLDNCSRGNAIRLKEVIEDIEFIQGDIRNENLVSSICNGISKIHHLAYINGTQNFYSYPDLVLDVATSGIINMFNACKKNEIKEFFLASSSEVYQVPSLIPTTEDERLIVPDPMNPRYTYGGGKIICELMAIHAISKYVDKTVIFRPHNVYGPDMGEEHVIPQFLRRIYTLKKNHIQGKLPFKIQGNGSETRAFIHVSDFVDALKLVIDKGKNLEIYHIGNCDEISISQLAFNIAEIVNLEIDLVPGPLTKGSTERRCPDISKIESIGYKQKIGIKEGIKTLVEWYYKEI